MESAALPHIALASPGLEPEGVSAAAVIASLALANARLQAALPAVFAFHDELFLDHPTESALAVDGVGVAPSSVAAEVGAVLDQVFAVSAVERPMTPQVGPVAGGTGRHGRHTEALSHLLAEMQSVARAHPRGQW